MENACPLEARASAALKAIFQDLSDHPEANFDLYTMRKLFPEAQQPRGFQGLTPEYYGMGDPFVQERARPWTQFLARVINQAPSLPEPCDYAVPSMRLATKVEPAGKVRVFTILDSISQRLHSMIGSATF